MYILAPLLYLYYMKQAKKKDFFSIINFGNILFYIELLYVPPVLTCTIIKRCQQQSALYMNTMSTLIGRRVLNVLIFLIKHYFLTFLLLTLSISN
jgi:hypothetical protein